jgi:hypothetical protein
VQIIVGSKVLADTNKKNNLAIWYQKRNLIKEYYYLRRLFKNCVLLVEERKREVCMDKEYNYESYNCNDNSIWGPNNKKDDLTEKAKYTGCCFCFVAAIQRPNLKVSESHAVIDIAGLVLGIVWVFCLTTKKSSQGRLLQSL